MDFQDFQEFLVFFLVLFTGVFLPTTDTMATPPTPSPTPQEAPMDVMSVASAPDMAPVTPNLLLASIPSVPTVRSVPRSARPPRVRPPRSSRRRPSQPDRPSRTPRTPPETSPTSTPPDQRAPTEMVLKSLPIRMTDVPDWVFSELKEAIPPGLTKLLFKAWFSYLYGPLDLVTTMTPPPYEQVIYAIGRVSFPGLQDTVVQFLTILYFLRGIAAYPQARWTYMDFLDSKASSSNEITQALQQALDSLPSPGPIPVPHPPPYSRVSTFVAPPSAKFKRETNAF